MKGTALTKHRRTDPICVRYRKATNPFTRWRYRRNHGRACVPCMREREANRAAINAERRHSARGWRDIEPWWPPSA